MEAWLEIGSGGQLSTSVRPDNLATGFRPHSATVVSTEPFLHGTETLRCLQKEMITYSDLCRCGETQTTSHIIKSCPLTKMNGGLFRLHSADEDAVSWLLLIGGCWAAPSRHISAQLFRLECAKFIFDVSSSQGCRRAASSDSMRWSAMSGSPDSWYCFSKSWDSSSKHGVYVGRKPRGMECRAAFCIAPQKRCYDSSMLMHWCMLSQEWKTLWEAIAWRMLWLTLACTSHPALFVDVVVFIVFFV